MYYDVHTPLAPPQGPIELTICSNRPPHAAARVRRDCIDVGGHYLRHLFKNLPFAQTQEDHLALLPRRLTPELLNRALS